MGHLLLKWGARLTGIGVFFVLSGLGVRYFINNLTECNKYFPCPVSSTQIPAAVGHVDYFAVQTTLYWYGAFFVIVGLMLLVINHFRERVPKQAQDEISARELSKQ